MICKKSPGKSLLIARGINSNSYAYIATGITIIAGPAISVTSSGRLNACMPSPCNPENNSSSRVLRKMDRFSLYTHMKLLLSSILLYLPNRFIPANIPDFHSQGPFIALDSAVPELFGFLAVADDIAQLVDFDFAVRMPFALSAGAIQA